MHAGQGLVAFARGLHDQLNYAIKFFLVQNSLAAELALYGSQDLGSLLPQVRDSALHVHAVLCRVYSSSSACCSKCTRGVLECVRAGWRRKASALQVVQVYDPAQAAEKLTDTSGAALPAFIVMERGEASATGAKERSRNFSRALLCDPEAAV